MYASVAANSANSAPPTAASAMVEVDSDFDEGIALGAVVSLPYGAGISGEDVEDVSAMVSLLDCTGISSDDVGDIGAVVGD